MNANRYIIGITGDIASGKSQITNYLKSINKIVLDADEIAKELSFDKLVLNELKNEFKDVIINGKLDRKKLKDIVFNDEKKLEVLNSIFFKRVYDYIEKFINKSSESLLFIDAPLLFEANINELTTHIIFVDILREIQIKRLIKRNNISESEALKQINAFKNKDEKIKKSFVIYNNDKVEDLIYNFKVVIKKITSINI